MNSRNKIVEVDVLQWYGTEPDREEISNSIEAAQKQGWYLKDSELEGVGYSDKEQHYTLILYYAERPEQPPDQY